MTSMATMDDRPTGVRRVTAVFLVLVFMFAIFALPAAAATSSTKTVNSSGYATFKVTTGSGISYLWKNTTITIKNTGSYTITVYEVPTSGMYAGCMFYRGSIAPGQSKTFTMSGRNKSTSYKIQGKSNKAKATVTTTSGSVR